MSNSFAAKLVGPAKAELEAARKIQRTKGLSVISRINGNMDASPTSTLTADSFSSGTTTRIRHVNLTGKELLSVAPVYAHMKSASSTEDSVPSNMLIKPFIEPVAGDQTQRQAVFASGRHFFQLDRRAVVVCDETALYVPVGGSFYERTGATVTGSNSIIGRSQNALGGTTGFGQNTGEGSQTGDIAGGTTASTENTLQGFSCVVMMGRTVDGTVTNSLALIGDSTGVGVDDEEFGANAGGYLNRSAVDHPGTNLCIRGEKLSQYANINNFRTRLQIVALHTHCLDNGLINDVTSGRTVAQMKADILTIAYRMMSLGIHYIKGTCLSLVSSIAGFFHPSDQTVLPNEANRLSINQWLRDTTGTGFVAQATAAVAGISGAGKAYVIDPCKYYEVNASNVLTLDGGFIEGAQSAVLATGTASAGTTTVLTDSSKSWTVNEWQGYVVYITGGTGSGQARSVQSNTAAAITLGFAFTTAPDATSTYSIFDSNTVDGVHPSTGGHERITSRGLKADVDAIMAAS